MTRKGRMRKTLGPAFAVAAAMAGAGQAQDIAAGAESFAAHCATCHGSDAAGDGPMASILVKQPPDLTRLAARNGGLFPRARVVFRIDGRDQLVAHGGEMPIFGGLFEGNTVAIKDQSGQPILASEAIVDLVAWLETIQE